MSVKSRSLPGVVAAFAIVCMALLFSPAAYAQYSQQGPRLMGTGWTSNWQPQQGRSVALSADGNTALVGAPGDSNDDPANSGAAWVYVRTSAGWTQQAMLVGTGVAGAAGQGFSLSLSADGNVAAVGGPDDEGGAGAAWIFVRNSGTWTQHGNKLRGSGAVGPARQGTSVFISADGSTVIVGGPGDSGGAGAVWMFGKSDGTWTQQGDKRVGSGAAGMAEQGSSVALSADGTTAIVGGPADNPVSWVTVGAVWIWVRNGTSWSQQGPKLVGSGWMHNSSQGRSVALSADGNTAIVGAPGDYYVVLPRVGNLGAVWVWTRTGSAWTQQGERLVAEDAAWPSAQGTSVAVSADGNTFIAGGPGDAGNRGASWIWKRAGSSWTKLTSLVGSESLDSFQGTSVALSADASTALVGGSNWRRSGSAWVFVTAPPAPTALTAAWAAGAVHVSWTDVTYGEDGFKLERRDDPSGTYAPLATLPRNVNVHRDLSAVVTASYCYRVKATSSSGESAYSSESCVAGSAGTAGQTLRFSSATYSVAGTPGPASVTIDRLGGTTGSISATLLVGGGTALAGDDYSVLTNGAITFAPGEASKIVQPLRVLASNPLDSRTVTLKLSDPSGTVTIGSPASATLTIDSAAGGPAGAVEVLDTACVRSGAATSCAGKYLGASGFPVNAAALETMNVRRAGAVADGVTLLLLRVRSAAAVTFSLQVSGAPAPGEYGTLLRTDGTIGGASVTIAPLQTPAGPAAYALYLAPADVPFNPGNLRVVATSSGGSSEASIVLAPPPVLLLHGVWSGPGAFADQQRLAQSMYAYLVDRGFHVVTGSYSGDPAGSFDPRGDSTPILALADAAGAALRKARAHGLAASQADVVAHSMGGLVARARATGLLPQGFSFMRTPVNYRRAENRFKGEFHKLITIGTPHHGTPLAAWLLENKCDRVALAWSLEAAFEHLLGKRLDDAVYQFQPSHEVLTVVGRADVPTHTIAGRTPLLASMTEAYLDTFLKLTGHLTFVDSILGGSRNHDVIVPVASQLAGRTSGSGVSTVESAIHANFSLTGLDRPLAETTNTTIFSTVLSLLRGRVADHFEIVGPPSIAGVPVRKEQCPSPLPASPRHTFAAGVAGLTPAAGTIVHPGEDVRVQFIVPDDGVTTQAFLTIGGDMTVVEGAGGVFTLLSTIPADASGELPIAAMTARPDGENYVAQTHLTVLPAVHPTMITASPASLTLAVPNAAAQLVVTGHHEDGSSIALTAPSTGTVYSTDSGTSAVVTVSDGGLVSAIGNGEETIVVRNGALTAAVGVTVDIGNHRPELAAVPDTRLHPGAAADLPVSGSDVDGHTLQLAMIGAPSFATLTDHHDGTGLLRLRPAVTDAGDYSFSLLLTDDGAPPLGVSRTVTVTVYPPFTDDPLTPGSTRVRLVHVAELRARIDALRLRWDLTPFAWSNQPLASGNLIRAQHVLELRAALNAVYVKRGRTPPNYTDSSLGAGMGIRAVHVAQVRSAVIAME